jgi:hypothetical protein
MLGCLVPLTLRVYVTYHFWTPICNMLGYWRHRSVCYTYLFTTSLVVTTISVYNVLGPSDVVSRSGPGSSLDLPWSASSLLFSSPLLFCSVLFSSPLLFCVLCLGVSPLGVLSSISVSLSLFCVCVLSLSLRLSVYLLPLKYSVCVWERRHLPPRSHFPLLQFPAIGYLGILSS